MMNDSGIGSDTEISMNSSSTLTLTDSISPTYSSTYDHNHHSHSLGIFNHSTTNTSTLDQLYNSNENHDYSYDPFLSDTSTYHTNNHHYYGNNSSNRNDDFHSITLKLDPNSNRQCNNNNDHGYRKHLIEDVYFNIEQVDRLIEMLDERLERIQLMAIFNDRNNHHQREQQQQQQQSMMNVDHQQRPYIKQLLFTTEVIDLTCQQQNDDEQQQQQIAQQQPLNQELSSFIQLDGIVLPLPDEFCRMKVEKQQYLLQPLAQSVRQKYLEICSKNLSHDFLQLFSNLLKQF